MATITDSGLELFPISLARYDRMVAAGVLGPDDKVELLRGVLSVMSPHGDAHIGVISWLNAVLVLGTDLERFRVQPQLPVRLAGTNSEPEPDFSIVPAGRGRGRAAAASLVIEVSDSSLRRDLQIKRGIYAEGGVCELWIVDVPRRVVHVNRRPVGDRYEDVVERGSGTLTPLTAGVPSVDLDELFAQIR